MSMGYNSNLTDKQNKNMNSSFGGHHGLWKIGYVLRITGIIIVGLTLLFAILSGLGLAGFVLVLFFPTSWIGILFLALGQYFVSNWKNK